MQKITRICSNDMLGNLARAIGCFVGHGKAWSYDALSVETGIHMRRLYRFADASDEKSFPGGYELLLLFRALGSEFQNMITETIGHTGAVRMDLEFLPMELPALTAEFNYLFADAIRDTVYCHRDKAKLEPVVRRIVPAGLAMIGQRSVERIDA